MNAPLGEPRSRDRERSRDRDSMWLRNGRFLKGVFGRRAAKRVDEDMLRVF